MPAEQAQVVPQWEGLQGQTGEALHHLQVAQLEPEVVPALRCSRHDGFILRCHREENVTGSDPILWQRNQQETPRPNRVRRNQLKMAEPVQPLPLLWFYWTKPLTRFGFWK